MALARERGELAPVVTVRQYLEGILGAFRSKVLAIPSKLAPLVVGIKTTPAARDVIENHLHDALHELSRLDVSRFNPTEGSNEDGN